MPERKERISGCCPGLQSSLWARGKKRKKAGGKKAEEEVKRDLKDFKDNR